MKILLNLLFLSFSSYNLQSQITREVERARNEELRLDRKIDDEIARAKSEEKRIETKLDKEIDRSTQEDEDIHDELDEVKDKLEELEEAIDENMRIVLFDQSNTIWNFNTQSLDGLMPGPSAPNRVLLHYSDCVTENAKPTTTLRMGLCRLNGYVLAPHSGTVHFNIPCINILPYDFCQGDSNTELNNQSFSSSYSKPVANVILKAGFIAGPNHTADQLARRTNDYGHFGISFDVPNCTAGEGISFEFNISGAVVITNFNKSDWQNGDMNYVLSKLNGNWLQSCTSYNLVPFFQQMSVS